MNRVFKRTLWTTKTDDILIDSINSAVVITINRPKFLNAINKNMLLKMQPTLRTSIYEKKLAIIKGNGNNIFSCGGDVKDIYDLVQSDKLEEGLRVLKLIYETVYMTKYCKLPYIALIDGIAMGAGLSLSIHGRYRIATEKTIAAMPENRIGLVTDVSGTYSLPRLPRNFGIYMALTGAKVKGRSVVRAGIATHFVPQARLHELETSLMQCTNEAQIERVVEQFQEPADDQPLDDNIHHIERCFGAATVEEIIERLQALQNDWSKQVLKSITESSPMSMKITLRAFQKGAQMSLAQCIQMEFRINSRLCAEHDFSEGVRTVFLEKNNKPKWKPATLEEVTEAFVESCFAKLPPDQEIDLEFLKLLE